MQTPSITDTCGEIPGHKTPQAQDTEDGLLEGVADTDKLMEMLWDTRVKLSANAARQRPGAESLSARHEGLEHAVEEHTKVLLEAQRQLLQNENLALVGQLAPGIAHELNKPIRYIEDNLRVLADYFADIVTLVKAYRGFVRTARSGEIPVGTIDEIEVAEQKHDIDYILSDAPHVIERGLEGIHRVSHIIRAVKDLSHVNRGELSAVDLNQVCDDTPAVGKAVGTHSSEGH